MSLKYCPLGRYYRQSSIDWFYKMCCEYLSISSQSFRFCFRVLFVFFAKSSSNWPPVRIS